eukprot:XP_013994251.1 PREDICTED: RNA 3'-terminal phosphate cyclase-like protein isoform X1 [Salmo salar]
MLAPFMKNPLKAVLKGVTNDPMDFSFPRLWADPGGRDLFLSAEQLSTPLGQGDPVLPEDLRWNCAKLLLEEIYKVGCIDSTNQSLALMYMTLGQEHVCNALHGHLSLHTRLTYSDMTDFFHMRFKMETPTSSNLSFCP